MVEIAAEAWDEIERQYAAGVAVRVIAKTFNVSRGRIERKADQLGWARRVEDGDSARRSGCSGASRQARTSQVASLADQRKRLIDQQGAAWEPNKCLREDAYRLVRGETPQFIKGVLPDDMTARLSIAAQVFAMADKDANSLMRAQEGQRRAYGIDYKQQQENQAADEAKIRRQIELAQSVLAYLDKGITVNDPDAAVEAEAEPSEEPSQWPD
jgi:hypothetical protein